MDNYDANEFYTHATDRRGHSAAIRVAFLPETATLMRELVASPNYPAYKTVADVIRDAVFHRLVWLNENTPVDISSALEAWHADLVAEKLHERIQMSNRVVENLSEALYGTKGSAEDTKDVKTVIEGVIARSDITRRAKVELRDLLDRFNG